MSSSPASLKFTTDRFFTEEHQQPQDWGRLETYLASKGHRFNASPPPKQFVGGFGNLNFLILMNDKKHVLRRPPLGPLPPGANDMAREYKVTSKLWKLFPLAPKSIELCTDKEVLGAPFLIMEYRPGMVIHQDLPPELTSKTHELSKMVIDVLIDFQSVDPIKAGLNDLGRPEGFLERALAGWIKRFHVAAEDVYPGNSQPSSADDIIKWLQSAKLPESEPTLLHNDYKLNNIILDPENPTKPIALLDWDMCTRGDPLFDFATLLSYWMEPGDPPELNMVGQMPTSTTSGWMTREQITEYYAESSGRDISNIHFYRVLTAFKHCVIFMQIYARYCRGTTTDPRIAELGPVIDSLFEFTYDVLKKKFF